MVRKYKEKMFLFPDTLTPLIINYLTVWNILSPASPRPGTM